MKIDFKRVLFIILCILFFDNTTAQNREISDSLDLVIQRHLDKTPFYKRDQLNIDEEDIVKFVDARPAFGGVYRDTYFTTGVPLNRTIDKNTADVLFQISVRHRLTRSRLPFNTFLYLTYTQKSFWNLYAESAPFRDTNYNPALGLGKYIIHNNTLKGATFFQIEHESNGKDGDDSRSWNMISFSMRYFFNLQLAFGGRAWIPIVDGSKNKDLVDYRGNRLPDS